MWCGDYTFQEAFPELYVLSRLKDSLVTEVMDWSTRRIHWNVQFRRPPQDCEQEAFDRFMGFVYSSTVRGLVLIRFVGSQQGANVLRLEDFIILSTLPLLYPSLGE